jgi:hypothetical protein
MAATSDRHVMRLEFHSASVLIADYFHSGPLSDSETQARRLSVLASCARLAAEAGTP